MSALRHLRRILGSIRSKMMKNSDSDVPSSSDFEPRTDIGLGCTDTDTYDSDCDDDSECASEPPSEKPVDSVPYLMSLPFEVVKNYITHLGTVDLHTFRTASPEAAKLAEFRGIQTHVLYVDPAMAPGTVQSIVRYGRLITTASIDAVLATERVKVRDLLNIGAFDPAFTRQIAEHIDSSFKSVVLEGPADYRTLYALLGRDQNMTIRLKNGLQLPKSDHSRFWSFFPHQRISRVRRSFKQPELIVEATYDRGTDWHRLEVIPFQFWQDHCDYLM